MQPKTNSNLMIVSDSGEQATAELISATADKALRLIQESWGLGPPADCRIYVMTSWWGFFFRSAPWPWRIALAVGLPLWVFRAKQAWPFSAAWTQSYGRRVAIGIKPPRLLQASDKRIGAPIFVEEQEVEAKVRHVTCHELTHACSAHLKLPAWLNEGLAAVTVDRHLEKRTIRADTLELVQNFRPKAPPPTYRELLRLRGKTFAYHAVRGYWLVRYLEEKSPGFLKHLCASPRVAKSIEAEIAGELSMAPDGFWSQIDDRLAAYFEGESTSLDRHLDSPPPR